MTRPDELDGVIAQDTSACNDSGEEKRTTDQDPLLKEADGPPVFTLDLWQWTHGLLLELAQLA